VVECVQYRGPSMSERPIRSGFIHPDWVREGGGNIQKGIADAPKRLRVWIFIKASGCLIVSSILVVKLLAGTTCG
jgi:hypothetical protein